MSSEDELLRAWTPANLEAFGAALRAQGHPRGELIALDFVLERERSVRVRTALLEEKLEFQKQWLGEPGGEVITRFGFIERLTMDPAEQVQMLDQLAPFARSLWVWGIPARAVELVERIVEAPRPFLASLLVRSSHDDRKTTVIADALARRLIDATPNLHKLHVTGHGTFADVPHPAVEHLVVDGFDAVGALVGRGTLPNVRTLDFALAVDSYYQRTPPPELLRAGLVPPSAFPRLATLDVSRNEPREHTLEPNCLAGGTALYDVLERFLILRHVAELRLPSVRTTAQAREVQRIVDNSPALRRATLARVYGSQHLAPKHARIVVPAPVAWPAANALRQSDALMFQGAAEWVRLDLSHAYRHVEQYYDRLPADERAAWDALWDLVQTLGTTNAERVELFPRHHLHAVCTSIANTDIDWFDTFGKQFIDHAAAAIEVRRTDRWEKRIDDKPGGPRERATSERIAEHERALQAEWDLERLAVYADELQQHGDLRGNLIAIDLQHLREPDVELTLQHDDLHEKIFGEGFSVNSHLGLAIVDMSSYGSGGAFADKVVDDVARYLGEIEISGDRAWLTAALAHTCAEPRPWLRVVRIDAGLVPSFECWSTKLAAAAPNLEELDLTVQEPSPAMLEDFAHPRVRRMKITGVHGFESLGDPWPALTALDFAYGHDDNEVPTNPDRLLRGENMPALRSIDFSRNEPPGQGYDHHERHHCRLPFFTTLPWLDDALVAGLTHVKLPSPRTIADVAAIQRLLDRAPALESLEIVRRYPKGPPVELVHPRAQLVIPAPVSWPPFDRVVARSALAFDKVLVPLGQAITAMESYHAGLSEPGRRAWDELWALAEDPLRAQFELPAETLYTAVDALIAMRRYHKDWLKQLVAYVHPLALAQKTLTIRRAAQR